MIAENLRDAISAFLSKTKAIVKLNNERDKRDPGDQMLEGMHKNTRKIPIDNHLIIVQKEEVREPSMKVFDEGQTQ